MLSIPRRRRPRTLLQHCAFIGMAALEVALFFWLLLVVPR